VCGDGPYSGKADTMRNDSTRSSSGQGQPGQATGNGPDSIHLATALLAIAVGLSPLLPKEDGTKHPEGRWKLLQTTPATEATIRSWYRRGRTGNGLATGYGHVECLEFDDGPVYERFKEAAAALGIGDLVERIEAGYSEATPGGGIHWLYRCDEISGNTKLAERPAPTEKNPHGRKPLIETRGVGGFVVTAPSNGKVHRSGNPYVLLRGGLETIVTITPDERQALWELARTFDEIPVDLSAEPGFKTTAHDGSGQYEDGKRPGDDYNARATWEDILEPYGWSVVHTSGGVTYWRRPGDDKTEGWSATTGATKGFRVFTSSTSLKTESYSRFGLYCHLQHKGDWKACVKDLAGQGYGTWIDENGEEHQNPRPPGHKQGAKKKAAEKPRKSGSSGSQPEYICSSRSGEPISCASNTKIWLALNRPADHAQYDRFRQRILIDGNPLTDQGVIDLTMEIEASMQTPWSQEHVRSALVHLAHQRDFSSLVRWLESLRWDGTERINKFFADHYESEDDVYSGECARVFFLSAVARAFEPGCQADIMPVLIGPQGIGKSMGMAALCPDDDWFADDLGCDLFAGKAAEGLQGKWLFEFGEFARINRSTLDVVKSFITRRVDHYRPPYGRTAQDFPRSCVFFGTTNIEQPLQDIENRRFLPIKVLQANIPTIKASRDQLWAEAVRRYKAGEKWHVTCPHLLAEICPHLESARSVDAWETILREKLEGHDQTTMIEAAQLLGLWDDRSGPIVNRLGKPEQTRIGTALAAIGFHRERDKRPSRGYHYERTLSPP
jgi:hypothetical protein